MGSENLSSSFLLFGLFWSAQFNCVFSADKGKADIKSIKKCPVAGSGGNEMMAEPKLVQDGADKYVDFTLETSFDIDDQFTYSMNIQKLIGSLYVSLMNLEGDFCTAVDNYVKPIWTKARQEAKPQLPMDECKVPAGKYTLEQFRVNADEYTIPPGLKGTFQVEGKGYKGDGTEVVCFLVEVEVQ